MMIKIRSEPGLTFSNAGHGTTCCINRYSRMNYDCDESDRAISEEERDKNQRINNV